MLNSNSLDKPTLDIYTGLFEAMYTSRMVDELEDEFTSRGEAFFHVSGAGHEAVAALNPHLIKQDFLHCHYRDKALMIARGIPPEMFFHSLFCKDKSHSRGRQMSAHLSDPSLNILSLVGPVGNNALQSVGVANAIKDTKENPIVLCAVGDGTSQQGEFLEAIAEAVRSSLPVLFLIEDNKFSISTTTKSKTFYDTPNHKPDSFYGLPIIRINGKDTTESYEKFKEIVSKMRDNREPTIVLFEVERLSSHTNADDQRTYRTQEEITNIRKIHDPLIILEKYLVSNGIEIKTLEKIKSKISSEVKSACDRSRKSPNPKPIFEAKKPLLSKLSSSEFEYRGKQNLSEEEDRLTMIDAIREVFDYHLTHDKQVILYGEDIEDPKGDVFGLTKGLTLKHPNRVINSALAESTILGVSIGRALAGQKPVAFLQFADFLPIAFNQILSELGSMFWRTDGGWESPVIVMITCGGYRPGLGPFHAQTLESIAAHTPGVDVFMPSTAGDAAGLLNAAFASERPTLFFYPKSCLNDRKESTSSDISKQLIPIGFSRVVRNGKDITFISWGNGVSLCRQAAEPLSESGLESEIIDLRSISPWDKKQVLSSSEKTGKLIVVHEDNHTCGMGAEIIATVSEFAKKPVITSRVTRADTYIPCNFENQLEVLPSYKQILEEACRLLNLEITWELPTVSEDGFKFIEAIGTSPSDESVKIIEWQIKVGDEVKEGEYIGEFEADKTVSDFLSPITGKVIEILVKTNQAVKIGTPLVKVKQAENIMYIEKPITQENPGNPIIKIKQGTQKKQISYTSNVEGRSLLDVGISLPYVEWGARAVSNEKIASEITDKTSDNIAESTGIANRLYIDDSQDVLSIAIQAAQKLLLREKVHINDIDLIIASTGTPDMITPSLACRILYGLNSLYYESKELFAKIPAYDINAACSGYLYALKSAYDFLQVDPSSQVLLITSEVLSPLLDKKDFLTASIFADSATATLIRGANQLNGSIATLLKPYLTADGEKGELLTVPLKNSIQNGVGCFIQMKGQEVYQRAVRQMVRTLKKVCSDERVNIEDIDLIVPHQANQNIIDSVRFALKLSEEKVFSHIADHGNTSSSTIPAALTESLPKLKSGQKVGLVAFGGGFTFGASILEML